MCDSNLIKKLQMSEQNNLKKDFLLQGAQLYEEKSEANDEWVGHDVRDEQNNLEIK